jgi:hypothetical protein
LLEPIDFPSKMVPCKFHFHLPFFGLGPSSKGHGSKLWLSSKSTALFHWTLDLGPSSKVATSLNQRSYYLMKVALGRDYVMPLGTLWELTLTNVHLLGVTNTRERLCYIIGNFVHNLLDSWCSICQWQAFERAFEPKRELMVKYGISLGWQIMVTWWMNPSRHTMCFWGVNLWCRKKY